MARWQDGKVTISRITHHVSSNTENLQSTICNLQFQRVNMSTDLTPELIQHNLSSAIIGSTIEQYDQAGSTNDLIRQQARAGHAEGLVILADQQTAGRGRMGRAWAAPPGSSLLLSLLLRP